MSNGTNATSGSFQSSGNAISGGYNGDSFTVEALIVFFTGLSIYNAVELLVMILLTFTHFGGLYFWALIIAAIGIIPYSIGFLLKFLVLDIDNSLRWLAVVFITIGWWTMVTGQSVVLWSRLHLLVSGTQGERTLKWTKWMIIINFFILHVPTTILTFGSNGNIHTERFVDVFSVYEKIQMVGFFLQETILSSIYIMQTIRLLRVSLQESTRKLMIQLFAVNVIIIAMDIALLGLEFGNQYIWETETKSVIYSIKLKLEFAVLGQLVKIVGGDKIDSARQESKWIEETDKGAAVAPTMSISHDVPDFVDTHRISTDITHAQEPRARKSLRKSSEEVDLARFEHLDNVTTLSSVRESVKKT